MISILINNNQLPEPPHKEGELYKVVKILGKSFELKYETMVGERGVTLSGGQKQRISIARMLADKREILIFDDSLSAVDGTTESNIIKNLKTIRKNKTNIIIAHRLTAVEECDEIIVIDNGKITEKGNHQELMNQKGWYYEQYVIQEMGGNSHDA